MRKSLMVMIFLTACAQTPREGVWRDLQAQGDPNRLRGQYAIEQDKAQCEYAMARAQTGASQYTLNPAPAQTHSGAQVNASIANLGSALISGVPSSFYYKCMRAQGWEFLGYK